MAKTKKVREQFTGLIESLDQEGRGISKRDGKVIFVEGALPAEEVTYEVYRKKPAYEQGLALEVLTASSDRVAPKCPYFGVKDGSCGGCAMQHLDAEAQVKSKEKNLLDALWHIGRVRPEVVIESLKGPVWGYRHRARLSVRDVPKKGAVLVGFHEKRSSFIADMKSCEILPQSVSDLLIPLRELIGSLEIRSKIPQIEVAATEDCTALVLRVLEMPSAADEEKIRGFQDHFKTDIWYQPKGPDSIYPIDPGRARNLKLRHRKSNVEIVFKPSDFTQVNHRLNEMMVSRALHLLDLKEDERAVDFFCGLGNFTLPMARNCEKVLGIEGSESLVERARGGAADNGLSEKTDFVARNLFTWTVEDWTAVWEKMGRVDKVLIDPPRDGAAAVCEAFAKTDKRPSRIVYVSCNPATLARDAGTLVREGGWRLRGAGVMNMFPHTAHVESIAVFEPADLAQEKSDSKQSDL